MLAALAKHFNALFECLNKNISNILNNKTLNKTIFIPFGNLKHLLFIHKNVKIGLKLSVNFTFK